MFIITIHGKEEEGAYAVPNSYGENILYLFEQEDDAARYAMMLEEDDFPEMHVIEIDDDMIFKLCESHGYQYTLITPNDIVIPPEIKNDYI